MPSWAKQLLISQGVGALHMVINIFGGHLTDAEKNVLNQAADLLLEIVNRAAHSPA